MGFFSLGVYFGNFRTSAGHNKFPIFFPFSAFDNSVVSAKTKCIMYETKCIIIYEIRTTNRQNI